MNQAKHATKVFLFLQVGLFSFSFCTAQGKNFQSIITSLDKLLATGKKADSVKVKMQVMPFFNKEDERYWTIAKRYLYRLDEKKTVDSISEVETVKFPEGIIARNREEAEIYKIQDAAAKESSYEVWIKKYPPEKFNMGSQEDNIVYDYLRANIAADYAKENKVDKVAYFIGLLDVDFWKGNAYGGVAKSFLSNNNLEQAEIYTKKEMDLAYSYKDGKKGNDNRAKFAASGYLGAMRQYADVLFRQKKYKEAYGYIKTAYDSSKTVSPQTNYKYAVILSSMGKDSVAFGVLKEVVVLGRADSSMMAEFKNLYTKVKGSDAGFDDYASSLRTAYLKNLQKEVDSKEVDLPSVNFTLKDINGKTVSLSDYAGKVVILDFWATWCGPCKASFPAMQMAVNKYSKDNNVQFLFIHTWEQSATATQDAANYVHSNNYNFEVLMDLKDKATGSNKVVSSYNVRGIPAKFVIDPKGRIRFQLTGFDGSNEAAVDELSMMIEKAKS